MDEKLRLERIAKRTLLIAEGKEPLGDTKLNDAVPPAAVTVTGFGDGGKRPRQRSQWLRRHDR